MKKLILICALGAGMLFAPKASAQVTLTDEEYNYVTLDLQGILNLTMTTNPQVDFTFKTVQDYRQGITKFNATKLQVDATVGWDLYVYAKTDNWVDVEKYSTNGITTLPSRALGIRSSYNNASPVDGTDGKGITTAFTSLRGITDTPGGVAGTATQFIGGAFDKTGAAGKFMAPGVAAANANNNFRIDYSLKPGIPANFAKINAAIDREGAAGSVMDPVDPLHYLAAGFYYLEIVYVLTEDI